MKSSLIECNSLTILARHIRDITRGRQTFLITDENVSDCWLGEILPRIDQKGAIEVMEVNAGEDSKSASVVFHIINQLIDTDAGKDAIIINFGGGMVCDLGGFVASIYKRGIDHINIPTSLLAMTDAASGGKTGINQNNVKNVVGTFHLPKQVLYYRHFLETLPQAELRSGFAEMLKHGILSGKTLWKKLINLDPNEIPDMETIFNCVGIKEKIVKSDPLEKGARKLLNLGHSFGHAYESYYLQTGKPLQHGFCVSMGIITESLLAKNMKLAQRSDTEEIIRGVRRFFPSGEFVLPSFDEIKPFLLQDKKNQKGKLRMTLPIMPGKAEYNIEVTLSAAQKAHDQTLATNA
jgi:3-dehydroquinate synthase